MGTRGVVASASPLASAAGLKVLMDGGNAVDASVTVASILSIDEPYFSGIGGHGILMLHLADTSEVKCLDFGGFAPHDFTIDQGGRVAPGDCSPEALTRSGLRRFPPSGSSADVPRGYRSTTLSSGVDMDSSVNASVMFPQLRLTPTRAAFARPGPHATAFPDVLAPMQPSDSLVPVGRRSGYPSPAAYPGAEVLFFTAAPVPPQTGATPETFLPRRPRRLSTVEKTRPYMEHPITH